MILSPRLVGAELLQLRTTRGTWALAAAAAAAAAGIACIELATSPDGDLRGEEGLREVLAPAGSAAALFALVLGILAVTDEYRHRTVWQTFTSARSRGEAVVARTLACAAAGLLLGLVALALAYAVAAIWTESRDLGLSLADPPAADIAAGSLAACALLGAAGAGLGEIVRSQPAAIAVGLGWVLLIDTVLVRAIPEVGRFSAGGAQAALVGQPREELVSAAAGGLLLLCYAALLLAAAAHLAGSRDVL